MSLQAEQQKEDTPCYASIKSILHSVGKDEVLVRATNHLQPVIGIHKWTWLGSVKITELSRKGEWEHKIPNESTLRRRANYMASPLWIDEGVPRPADQPPLWEHLSLEYPDQNPWKNGGVTERQSTYRLVSFRKASELFTVASIGRDG